MTTKGVIQAVARVALGLTPSVRLKEVLEGELFAVVLPAVHEGDAPEIVGRTLTRLYLALSEQADVRGAARTAFERLCRDPAARVLMPVEAVIAGLEDAALCPQFTYVEVERLASMPWSELTASLEDDSSVQSRVENLRLELAAILHEVEEGFVESTAQAPSVARSAAALASELRSSGI